MPAGPRGWFLRCPGGDVGRAHAVAVYRKCWLGLEPPRNGFGDMAKVGWAAFSQVLEILLPLCSVWAPGRQYLFSAVGPRGPQKMFFGGPVDVCVCLLMSSSGAAGGSNAPRGGVGRLFAGLGDISGVSGFAHVGNQSPRAVAWADRALFQLGLDRLELYATAPARHGPPGRNNEDRAR